MSRDLPTACGIVAGLLVGGCQGDVTSPEDPVGGQNLSAAATRTVEVQQFTFEDVTFVSCANGGAGEFVALTGEIRAWRRTTVDGNGGLHDVTHVQPLRTSGVGLTTGDKYREVGAFQTVFNAKAGSTTTAVRIFKLVGQGSGNNLTIRENLHLTVNANGDVTAAVDNLKIECK